MTHRFRTAALVTTNSIVSSDLLRTKVDSNYRCIYNRSNFFKEWKCFDLLITLYRYNSVKIIGKYLIMSNILYIYTSYLRPHTHIYTYIYDNKSMIYPFSRGTYKNLHQRIFRPTHRLRSTAVDNTMMG